jgi:hypothetical protein
MRLTCSLLKSENYDYAIDGIRHIDKSGISVVGAVQLIGNIVPMKNPMNAPF